MTFTDVLRKENEDIFQMIFDHPFVQGIGKGELPSEALAHYIKADYEYLNAFIRVYGIAISKSLMRDEMSYFHDQIHFTIHDEVKPHLNFCDYIGVSYEELQGYPLPPTADHYIKHMMYHAQVGTLGETLAALLPCPWTYFEIGQELVKKYSPTAGHPFYKWISFYADSESATLEMRKRLDTLAGDASLEEQARMKDAFRKSCQLELGFWEMSLTCEEWPSNRTVSNL
ncbi:thiaminase II [Oceanobacillus bengalensis]|uniref:Aminopyrimidine aminohydrolase n=1 Tax=Oceanobacillus bengalensis TaxID=1435466 RepID=A0A494YYY0_9BACI|nr:thiaminase II [Oceanobacillus bengalensis]RKQ15404.1 thiaminase II [Oceanobacillus bengalensis]